MKQLTCDTVLSLCNGMENNMHQFWSFFASDKYTVAYSKPENPQVNLVQTLVMPTE